MSTSPKFATDVFISYTHIDNNPVAGEDEGWVARFDRSLRVRLSQWLGNEARVWRDQKLGGNDEFPATLTDTVADAAVFLMVVSPRYVRSQWCLRELHTFCEGAARRQGLRLENKSRIFKVLKMPVDVGAQPPEVQDMLGYEFYEGESRRPREFSQDTGTHKDPRYWERLDDVAYEMAELLRGLDADAESSPAAADAEAAPVYLATTTSDLEEEYLQVKRELQQRGHEVLPDRPLPYTASEAREAIASMLERCTLGVHLVGANYGMVPEGSEQSLVEMQHRVAAEYARARPELRRLIWMPVGLAAEDRRQVGFLEAIATDPVALDVLQTDLDELKASILHVLERPEAEEPEPDAPIEGETERRVYVVFHEGDIDAVGPLLDLLFEVGVEYDYPQFEGDEAEREAVHQRLLAECSAVILFYGCAEEVWFRNMWELVRVAPDGLAKAVVIGPPKIPSKRLFRTRESEVMHAYDEFPDEALRAFLAGVGS